MYSERRNAWCVRLPAFINRTCGAAEARAAGFCPRLRFVVVYYPPASKSLLSLFETIAEQAILCHQIIVAESMMDI
jgi:hypothetical protein